MKDHEGIVWQGLCDGLSEPDPPLCLTEPPFVADSGIIQPAPHAGKVLLCR